MTYETNKYAEFFVIDEGYYPEINESSIQDPKNKWQNTFPHSAIVEILKLAERTLSRSEKKSLWIEGSYGTGKSRILWMMQNLLECSEEEFDAYFDEYDNLRDEIDLRERLRAIRRGKVVTAYRYATGDITSTQKLIFAVFETLTAALQKGGYKFDGAKTLRGRIANWLEADSANLEMFRAKIRKPEYRMSAAFGNRSAEEIVERLKNSQIGISELVEEILKLGEREGIRAFNIGMNDLINWITEVIAENNLKAMVLFWDEFSKFFENNRNNFDEFQHLAELSNIAPFYLVIATYEFKNLYENGGQSFRAISDRFNHKNITMPDNIALELVGHALKVKEVAKNDWYHISAALRERTAEPRRIIMDFAGIREEKILTDILPIHPVTAILLKNLAVYFASNQRSIFNFIKNNDPKVKAFQDFISSKSPEEGDLLTADYLWNFFYESGTDEHGSSVGRMNLKPSVRTILDSYVLNKDKLNFEEQAVLKTVLFFQAVDQESHGNVEIFKPTKKNLELAFAGVEAMENGRVINIANDLVRKEILFKRPDKVETFAAMTLSGDLVEIERLQKSIAERVRTADLVESAKLLDEIILTPAQKSRYVLQAVTADNFNLTIGRLSKEKIDYRIKAVVCFARNENERNKIYELLCAALSDSRYHRLAFIDASSNLINSAVFGRWVDNTANEKYWRGKENDLSDKMKSNAEDCLREWRDSFSTGAFVYYPAAKNFEGERRGISCQKISQIKDEMTDNVRLLYPYSFDDAGIIETLFQATNLKRLSEAGINREEFSMMKKDAAKIILGDVWQMSGNYWEVCPDLSISRLKVELDALIKSEIEKTTRIAFDEIINFLLERGFMPLNVYAFLTGFLLKEYANDSYRFGSGVDGNLGDVLSPQKLAECIGESLKQSFNPSRNYRPKYLEIISPNQRQFMEFVSEVFDAPENFSVEQSAQTLRLKFKNLDCPLWCYIDAAEEKYKDFLYLLAETANSKQAVSVSTLAERAGQFLIKNSETAHDLKIFFTPDNGRQIFSDFMKNFEGGIIFKLAETIGIRDVVKECLTRLKNQKKILLQDKEAAQDELRNLIVEYKIVNASRTFGIKGNSLNACLVDWKDFCRYNLKIPCEMFCEYHTPIKDFFTMLKEIVSRGDLPQSKYENFLRHLTENAEQIGKALNSTQEILLARYSSPLKGLNEKELNEIYASLPYSSFTDARGHYFKNLSDKAKEIRNGQLKHKLLKLWREVAGNKLPREWSKVNRTPIMAMVPKSEEENAEKVFVTIMATSPDEKDVKFAIDYLKKKPTYFAAIKAESQTESSFREAIIGNRQVLLDDNEEVRNEIETNFSGDFYQWYPNVRVEEIVEEFTKNKYYSGGAYDKLTERVMRMSNEDAKKLLIKLLDKNYEVGMALLREDWHENF
ncbi:MAG: hypothetical protein IKO74_12145 [Selenomonadaceae bacterium]|nr:hypothetical protein [Selenomonadaceae bacterium]